MNKIILFTALIIASISVNAQKKEAIKKPTEKNYSKKAAKFSATTKDNSAVDVKKQTLLEELYLIEDERNRIENNNSLSSFDRDQKIQSNNTAFNNKRSEFKSYVFSKGILNVTKNEQSYYLSILKQDKQIEEYKKNIALINNSK